MRGEFTIKGLDAYLEAFARANVNVDKVITDVLTEAAPIAEAELEKNLLKTRQAGEIWTGETQGSIVASEVKRDGNFQYIELSVGGPGVPQAFYKEYGTTRQAAEPFVRPSFRKLRRTQIKKMLKQVLDAFGLKA